jgi:Flp pilus assembly protein TadD
VITIVLSLIFGLTVGATLRLTGAVHSVGGAITPGVIAAIVAAVFLLRRVGKMLNPLVDEAQRHIQGGRRELGLKALQKGLTLARWHPLIEGQLRTQIGVLHYAAGKLDEAIDELQKGSARPWEGRAFLGAALFRQKKDDKLMEKAFEKAVKLQPKDAIPWTLYAFCLNGRSQKDAAIAVLERAKKEIPNDQRIDANIELLKEGKKLKVAPYGDRWAAFSVDGSVAGVSHVPKAMRGFAQRPGFRQKPQKKR